MYSFAKYKDQYRMNLRLALPVVLTQVGLILVQLVDNAMVGRLGAAQLAGVGFAGAVFWAVFCLVMGITMGLTPLVGEMYAKGQHKVTASYLQNSLLLFFVLGLLFFVLQYSAAYLMPHLGQQPEVVEQAVPYYKYLAWSVLPYMLFAPFKQFLEGVGNTTIEMVTILTANVVNIFFNWLLIYGNWGFPAMGAAGAGLATLISRSLTPFMIIGYFVARGKYARYFGFFSWRGFSRARMASILKVGVPIGSQMMLENAAFVCTTFMMGWIGTAALAANQIAINFANLAFMVIIGIGAATTIRVSHEYGRHDLPQLRMATRAAYHIGICWNFVTALIFIALRNYIPLIFTDDPEVIRVASMLLVMVAAFQIADGIQAITIGTLRGVQDVKILIWISLLAYVVINLPAGYFMAFVLDWGAAGLWLGFLFGISTAALLLSLRLRRQMGILKRNFGAKS
jgi:MATE family multidrug resistance protein